MLGLSMSHGRSFAQDECKPEAPAMAILSDAIWRRRFSADPSIVGKTIPLSGCSNRGRRRASSIVEFGRSSARSMDGS
jgi:hypothetical protein